MKTINDILDTVDRDAKTFVVVGPNVSTRKLEVHVHLPSDYLDTVRDAINQTIDSMKESSNDLH
jgi:hypothetical protein